MRHLANLKTKIKNQYGLEMTDPSWEAWYLLVGLLGALGKDFTTQEKVDGMRLAMAMREVDTFDMEEADAKLTNKAIGKAVELPGFVVFALQNVMSGKTEPVAQLEPTEAETPIVPVEPTADGQSNNVQPTDSYSKV